LQVTTNFKQIENKVLLSIMGFCKNHPESESNYYCSKHQIYLCEECLSCRDPEIFCRYRTSCTIWFLTKKGGNDIDRIE